MGEHYLRRAPHACPAVPASRFRGYSNFTEVERLMATRALSEQDAQAAAMEAVAIQWRQEQQQEGGHAWAVRHSYPSPVCTASAVQRVSAKTTLA